MKIEMVEPEPEPTPEPTPEPKPAEVPLITGLDDLRKKFFVAETKTLKNGDVEGYITTESVDRMGDVIKAKGWDLANYKKTGSPVLFGHEQSITAGGHIPHIGNAVEMEVQRKGIWSVTRFHEKTQLSREAALLAREKIVPNWSVGFNPLEAPEARMVDGEFKGFIFNRQELLEYSMVLVPANAEAVSKALFYARKGDLSIKVATVIAGPSPLAESDSGVDGKTTVPAVARPENDEHLAKMLGMHFLQRITP